MNNIGSGVVLHGLYYWPLCAEARNDDIGGEGNKIKSLNGFFQT